MSTKEFKQRFDLFASKIISYTFTIQLYKHNRYEGLAEIVFDLKEKHDLSIDVKVQEVGSLKINGENVEITLQDDELKLPAKNLVKGTNVVVIEYYNTYSDEMGLVKGNDSQGNMFLHTCLQPYHAQSVFPIFDQPNLKCKMKLNVVCPNKWTVLSNEKQIYQGKIDKHQILNHVKIQNSQDIVQFVQGYGGGKLWIFPETKVLSSYLLFVAAGALRYQDSALQTATPMSIYCFPNDYKKMLNLSGVIWEVTHQGMKFFQQYFGVPYQFNKYDQAFVSQVQIGMENAGISVINSTFLNIELDDTKGLQQLCIVLLHQLCHHWFGNLITMSYWNDVWINQALTSFLCVYCFHKIAPNLKSSPALQTMSMFMYVKQRGYQMDASKVSHPVKLKQPQLAQMFNPIVYDKGAAVIHQLHYIIGDKGFRLLCNQLLQKYKWSNLYMQDFILCGQKYFSPQIGLRGWVRMFLETPGFNTLTPQFDSKSGVVTITQNSPVKSLRYYAFEMSLFRGDGSFKTVEVVIDKVQTKVEVKPDVYEAVLLNSNDAAYVECHLDQRSLQFFKYNIGKVQDQLTRSIIHLCFIKQQADPQDFVQMFFNNLETKVSENTLVRNLKSCLKYLKDKGVHLLTASRRIKETLERQKQSTRKKILSKYVSIFDHEVDSLGLVHQPKEYKK